VKIIEQGIKPEDREWKASCGVCKTKFEFAEREAATTPSSDRDGTYILVFCPTCHAHCYGSLK
jgi:hypothetical protein